MIKNSHFLKLCYLYRKQIFILFLLSLLSSSFILIGPYFSKLFIDKAFINKDLSKFLNLSILGAIIFIFSILIKVAGDIIKNKIAIKLRLDLANKFIKKIFSLDLKFFQTKSIGENIYRLSDTESISNFILEQYPMFLVDIVKLPILLGVSLWLNTRMTIFFLILSPLFIIPNACLQRKLKPLYEEIWKNSAKLSQHIHEAFSRILIVKAFGLESYQRRSYIRTLINNIRWSIKSFRWTIISSLSSSVLSKAIFGGIALYGGWLIIKGRLSIGSYAAIMLYLKQLGSLFMSLGDRFGYFAQQTVSLDKFFEIMDIQPQIKDIVGAKILRSIKGEIRFKGLSFGYQKEKAIFKELDLNIPACSWVAIVGPSGCGKTTLINLILRLYEPWMGGIFLGEFDLKTIKLKSLREKIAIATQQPILFDVSVGENISYGSRGISQDEIETSAKIACVHDFITRLPHGYDSLVGEDACRLSQGLKQRITLARAILKNADLLILDEATSSVDSLTEENIFLALREKRQCLSTIIISHRLFSVKGADRIYFLGEGKIVEGTHAQLLSESKPYRVFFHNQMEEKIKE